MLRKVKCEIMSTTHNKQVDAYVLSESSMFVSKRRFILKTCGTTTPLECIADLNQLVKSYTGFDTIEVICDKIRFIKLFILPFSIIPLFILYPKMFCLQDIFYSRKNFSRPDLQLKPHRNFEQEVAILDEMFSDGAAYCMGTLNRQGTIANMHIVIVHY